MENIISHEGLIINQGNKLVSVDGEDINLTKKEYELLVFLITHPNYLHSREYLVKELWNDTVTVRTIDTTISRLRKKLGEYGSCITTRLGFGYSFHSEE